MSKSATGMVGVQSVRWSSWGWMALTAVACVLPTQSGSAAQPLEQGDRVIFLGDSITQAGAGPGGFVTLVREAIEKSDADLGIEVVGAGISGHRVPDLEKRLERDVLSKKPDVVVIYIGINDVWHSQSGRGTSKEDFEAGLKRLVKRITDAGARVILCTPSVIGEKPDGSNSLDKMLDEYCEISRRVAAETKSQLLDLRKQFVGYLKTHNPENADKDILTTDGVHLNARGNRFVAARMLEGLGFKVKPESVLRHVVFFKFKDDVTEAEVQEVVDAFAALPSKIDLILDFEYGTDISVENKANGLTHGFVVTFKDAADRDAYLPHPAHQEFVKLVGPRLDDVVVFDYMSKK